MNDAIKKISIKFNYSYLVIAKSTMLNNEFKNIKETLFQEFRKKLNNEYFYIFLIKLIKIYKFLISPLFGQIL